MKILFVGDIVGQGGREAVEGLLPGLKSKFGLDCVVANGENSAGGAGITPKIANELLRNGCDILTLGDHVWDRREELVDYLEDSPRMVRPANFPEGAPGKGWRIIETAQGIKIGVINLLGRVFMRYNINCPFKELRAAVSQIKASGVRVIVVDMHAEATSEKIALGHFIDGDVSAVVGTHTHVQTADEKILPKGTAYITDLGMTGPHDSVIGQDKFAIVQRFLTSIPTRFEVAKEDIRLSGVIVDIDELTGMARGISRIQEKLFEESK